MIRKSSGFTLIEFIIVVAIIGILAGVAMSAYREFIAESHGGAAMKGLQGFVSKARGCIITSIGCGSLSDEVDGISELSGKVESDIGGSLVWSDGACAVTASFNDGGGVSYSAASVSVVVSDEQCQRGAGL